MAFLLPRSANAVAVTESDVTIKTPDGTCDAYFVHPASGAAPGVLIWPDILGLRPAFRQMGKRLAESGYSVLVVNPFYRTKPSPVVPDGAKFSRPGDPQGAHGACAALNATTARHRRESVRRVARHAEQPSTRTARSARRATAWAGRSCAHGRGGAGSHRRRRVLPRRRPGHEEPRQPASAGAADEGAVPDRDRRERRQARAGIEERSCEGHLSRRPTCRPRSRSIRPRTAGARRTAQVYNEAQAEKAWSRLLALFGKALA